jgi:hypothetical protein
MSTILKYFNIPKSGKTKQRIAIRNIIEQIFLTIDGRNVSSTYRYEYKFDNEENWVWQLESDSYGEPYLITEREIEYY